MYRPTRPLQHAAGMRRILKQRDSTVEYIRKAVNSGVYRTTEELNAVWKERRESADDLRNIMRRFRQDIIRGSNVQDYPLEYRILEQHPPIPNPPRIAKKHRKNLPAEPNPVERLVEKYYRRQNQKQTSSTESDGAEISVDEYYRRLLGVPAPALTGASAVTSNSLALKPASLQKAYASAITHYRLQRTKNMSEEETLKAVDDLLHEHTMSAVNQSAQRTDAVSNRSAQEISDLYTPSEEDSETTTTTTDETLDGIFADNPRVVEGMMRWSDRLRAIPYREWTVGASTALDHWIARQILGVSEEIWWGALEGDEYLEVGRDIVLVRESLFPETVVSSSLQADGDDEEGEYGGASASADENATSVEDLLQSLLEMDNDGASKAEDFEAASPDDSTGKEGSLESVVDELQVWRHKQVSNKFENWEAAEQAKFDQFLQSEYLPKVLPGGKQSETEFEATRQKLLNVPPLTGRADSDAFWDALQDERTAREWLEQQNADSLPAAAEPWIAAGFWKLSSTEQLDRLLNLGAVRPLLDEYTSPAARSDFLAEHFDSLLTGVPVEHLVLDPAGPIPGKGADKKNNYSLETQPFGENRNDLLTAWTELKVGRAKYEEKLFQTGRLGLSYSEDDSKDDEDEW